MPLVIFKLYIQQYNIYYEFQDIRLATACAKSRLATVFTTCR